MAGMEKLKNVIREPGIVELKPWKSVHDTITAPMITAMGGRDIPGNRLSIGFAHIDKPDTIIDTAHKHPHDQWLFLIGTSDNFIQFDADIEFGLDKKLYEINYPFYAYIPSGMYHCPLVIKRVGKPIIFIDVRVADEKPAKPTAKKPAKKPTKK